MSENEQEITKNNNNKKLTKNKQKKSPKKYGTSGNLVPFNE